MKARALTPIIVFFRYIFGVTSLNSTIATDSLTLRQIAARLGSETATLICGDTVDPIVTTIEFADFTSPLTTEHTGTLLLAPSAPALHVALPQQTQQFWQSAVAAGCAAIVVQGEPSETMPLASLSSAAGLPLLSVNASISWRLIEALIADHLDHAASAQQHVAGGHEALFQLANQLGSTIGGSVAIEDLSRRVLAYSSGHGQQIDEFRLRGILERQVPDSPFNDPQYREVLQASGAIKFAAHAEHDARIAIAIRAGSLPLGSIWVIDPAGDAPANPNHLKLLTDLAAHCSAIMLNELRVNQAEQVPRERRFRTLLEGHNITGRELFELGFSEEQGQRVLVLGIDGAPSPADLALLRSSVYRHLSARRAQSVALVHRNRVYALIPNETQDTLTALLNPLIPLLQQTLRQQIYLVCSEPSFIASDLAPIRQLLDQILALVEQRKLTDTGQTRWIDEALPALLLSSVAEHLTNHTELQSPDIARMCAERPLIAATVLTWLQHFGNVSKAARQLHIHENTVRHRLQQAQEMFELTLDNADRRLSYWLQLRCVDFVRVGSHVH